VRTRRFFIIDIRSNVPNVGIRQADNLARVTWIGENFLISGEAGVENDFAAAPGAGARGATVKDSSVFERECRANCGRVRQWFLP